MSSPTRSVLARSAAVLAGTSLVLGFTAGPAWAKSPKSYLAQYTTPSSVTVSSADAATILPSITCKNTHQVIGPQVAFYDNLSDQGAIGTRPAERPHRVSAIGAEIVTLIQRPQTCQREIDGLTLRGLQPCDP